MTLVDMPDGSGFLMRPVTRGWCKYESAVDGTLDLVDFARLNDAINVYDENMRRLNERK